MAGIDTNGRCTEWSPIHIDGAYQFRRCPAAVEVVSVAAMEAIDLDCFPAGSPERRFPLTHRYQPVIPGPRRMGRGLETAPDRDVRRQLIDTKATMTTTEQATSDGAVEADVRPFHLAVPQAELDDLRRRLASTRWPDPETVPDTSQGPQLVKIKALVEHWTSRYDWRPAEALLNSLGQHITTIDGLDIHFLHIRSAEADALPMIMTHGWPGSVLEFRKVVGPLVDPVAHGGQAGDAFHLVVPSLPGFGFSGRPTGTGWDLERTARAWVTLMDRLGYPRFVAQGGDLGAGVTEEMAALTASTPTGLAGMHLNMAMFSPTPEEMAGATPAEQQMLAESRYYFDVLSGYAKQMSTRPQTIGYSLSDSPTGLASWIYAMFQDVGGSRGDAEAVFTADDDHAGRVRAQVPPLGRAALQRPAPLRPGGRRRSLRRPGAARPARRRDPRHLPQPALTPLSTAAITAATSSPDG